MTLFPSHQKEETALRRRLLFFPVYTTAAPRSFVDPAGDFAQFHCFFAEVVCAFLHFSTGFLVYLPAF